MHCDNFFLSVIYSAINYWITHSAHLSELGQHHDDGGVVFPQHPPEVFCGFSWRTLRGDVGLLLPDTQWERTRVHLHTHKHTRTDRSGLLCSPVSVDEAGVDVVRALDSSDWLQTDARGLVGHDVNQSVLEFVAGQIGTDEPWGVSFCVR